MWSILKKDKSFAVVGYRGTRKPDNAAGLHIVGMLEFKPIDLAYDRLIRAENKNAIQVDSVEVFNKFKYVGTGAFLYKSLIEYGFVLISDHTQYIGGRKLWEKLVKDPTIAVYVIRNGTSISDENGEPIRYDGKNIPDNIIWKEHQDSPEDSTRYTLLVAKKS